MSILRTVLRRSHSVLAAAEQKWPYLLALLGLLFIAVTVLLDSKRPLSNDELFTLYISRQRTLHDVWNALLTGAEQLPLFFFAIVRASARLFGDSQTALRLPETLGFLLMNVCTFLFVRRRVPAAYGLLAFIFPAVTEAYYFAYEARPYALVAGFCSLAMLFWQSAADGRRRPLSLIGTALALACAVNSHYYAVLLFVPFGIAELVRYYERRRFDWAMYVAIAASLLPLIFSLPAIRASSKYSSHFWAKPSWTSLISFYENLLIPAGLCLMLLAVICGLSMCWRLEKRPEASVSSGPPAHELGLAFGFVLLPLVAIFLAKFVTGAFTSRYAVYSVIGLSTLLAWSLARITRDKRGLGLVLAGTVSACWLVIAVRDYQQFIANQVAQDTAFEFLCTASSELAVVIASPHQFFVQSRVAAEKQRGHFIYLADVPLALQYTKTDTVERGLISLKNFAPLDVEDYHSFAASHQTFLVYGFPDPFGWVIQELLHSGRSISVQGRNGDSLLYLVKPSGSSGLSVGRTG